MPDPTGDSLAKHKRQGLGRIHEHPAGCAAGDSFDGGGHAKTAARETLDLCRRGGVILGRCIQLQGYALRRKVEIGGVAGLLAPLAGKQPQDTHVWILGGDAPAFVKLEGPLYLGGPIWRIELTSPLWQDH